MSRDGRQWSDFTAIPDGLKLFVIPRTACGCAGYVAQQAQQAGQDEQALFQRLLTEGKVDLSNRKTLGQFDSYRAGLIDGRVKLDAVERYVHQMAHSQFAEKGWLFLHGANGLGKTHLAVGAAKRLVWLSQQRVRMVYWPQVVQEIRAGWNGERASQETTEQGYWWQLSRRAIVVLDDVDKASGRWQLENLSAVLNHRYERKLVTIFTSNTGLADLADKWIRAAKPVEREFVQDFSKTIVDRMHERLWGLVALEGASYRQDYFGAATTQKRLRLDCGPSESKLDRGVRRL